MQGKVPRSEAYFRAFPERAEQRSQPNRPAPPSVLHLNNPSTRPASRDKGKTIQRYYLPNTGDSAHSLSGALTQPFDGQEVSCIQLIS